MKSSNSSNIEMRFSAVGADGRMLEARIFRRGCMALMKRSPVDLLLSDRDATFERCGVRFYEGCFTPTTQDVVIAGKYEGEFLQEIAWIRPVASREVTRDEKPIETVDTRLVDALLEAGAYRVKLSFGWRPLPLEGEIVVLNRTSLMFQDYLICSRELYQEICVVLPRLEELA